MFFRPSRFAWSKAEGGFVPGLLGLDYDPTEALDTPVAARLARRLQAYYQSRGWFEAEVQPNE